MPKKKTLDEILSEFESVHGNRNDYSLVEYRGTSTKVTVVCSSHGPFKITPLAHKGGVGCAKCYFDSQKLTKAEFVARSSHRWGTQYDYSFFEKLPPFGEKIPILCRQHGMSFFQEPRNHMRGHTGCPQCKSLKLSGSKVEVGNYKTQDQLNVWFTERARSVHGDRYDYSEFNYTGSERKGKIICGTHGPFLQAPGNHLRGANCPKCAREHLKDETFKEQCKKLGVNYHRALKRRQAGLTEEKIFYEEYLRNVRSINVIKVFGTKYPNLKEAARQLKPPASVTTIARWIKNGLSPEEAFRKIPNPGYANGIIYLVTCIPEQKQYIGLTIQTLEKRWKYHLEQANRLSIKGHESLHEAIRKYGNEAFSIKKVDSGCTKLDLEQKERDWIFRLKTTTPEGYNISKGGVSGGSNSVPTVVDAIKFESVKAASEHVARTRNISVAAAKRRIRFNRVNVKAPAKPGESLVHTKAYKAWSRLFHSVINRRSKDYIAGVKIDPRWNTFDGFLKDVGHPKEKDMAFARLDKSKGYYLENCAWLSKSEASRINAQNMKEKGNLTGRRKN